MSDEYRRKDLFVAMEDRRANQLRRDTGCIKRERLAFLGDLARDRERLIRLHAQREARVARVA